MYQKHLINRLLILIETNVLTYVYMCLQMHHYNGKITHFYVTVKKGPKVSKNGNAPLINAAAVLVVVYRYLSL